MDGQLANYGRHFLELARGSRQPKDTKEPRMIAIDQASRAHKTAGFRCLRGGASKLNTRLECSQTSAATRSVCIARCWYHQILPAPTNSSIGSSHCGATCTTTSNSCAARRHGQLAAFKQEAILPIAGFAPLDDTTHGASSLLSSGKDDFYRRLSSQLE
jgi:hypothetical protein